MMRRCAIVCVLVMAGACSPKVRWFRPYLGEDGGIGQGAAGQGSAGGGGVAGAGQGEAGTAGHGAAGDGGAGQGGAADAGVEPVILAIEQDHPWAITVAGTYVYWQTDGYGNNDARLWRVPTTGGIPTVLASGADLEYVSRLAVDASYVYWASHTAYKVMKAPIAGGTPILITSATGAISMAIDTSYVYFASEDKLMKAPKAGGSPITLASAQFNPIGLAVDSTSLYWTDQKIGTILKVPLLYGSNPILLAAGQSIWTGDAILAVDSTDVYWADNQHGTVMKVSKDGTDPTVQPTTLAQGYVNLRCLAIDSTHVYWAADNWMFKIPKSGGTPIPIVSDWNLMCLAVDSTSVYWYTLEAIKKAPK